MISITPTSGLRAALRALPLLFLAAACGTPDVDRVDTSRQNIQRIPCSTDNDCTRGGSCTNSQCTAGNECTTDRDCGPAQACVADLNFGGLCGAAGTTPTPTPVNPPPACTTDSDCAAGEACQAGACVPVSTPACTTDSDCAAGEACQAGACVPANPAACTTDADCPAREVCQGGVCQAPNPGCTSDADCNPAEVCQNGQCTGAIPACASDADCTAPETCVRGQCLPPAPPTEDCTNGVDDDANGDVDCADLYCQRDPACVSTPNGCDVLLQNCSNGDACWVNGPSSGDGFCAPPGGKAAGEACFGFTFGSEDCGVGLLCVYANETDPAGTCRAFCDQSADCAAGEACYSIDPTINFGVCATVTTPGACSTDADCAPGQVCQGGVCGAAPPPPAEDCGNGVDDDGDGDVDCADAECTRNPVCP